MLALLGRAMTIANGRANFQPYTMALQSQVSDRGSTAFIMAR